MASLMGSAGRGTPATGGGATGDGSAMKSVKTVKSDAMASSVASTTKSATSVMLASGVASRVRARARWKKAITHVTAATYVKTIAAPRLVSRVIGEATHYLAPVTFDTGNAARTFVLTLLLPWSLPLFFLLYGKLWLRRRDLSPCAPVTLMHCALGLLLQTAVVLKAAHPDSAVTWSQVLHNVLLQVTWSAMLAIKYGLVRYKGNKEVKVLSEREWQQPSVTTILEQLELAEQREGVVLERHKCVFDPVDSAVVKLRMAPALKAYPSLSIDVNEGTFPAHLLLARVVMSLTQDTIEYERKHLKVERHKEVPFLKKWRDELSWTFALILVAVAPVILRGATGGGAGSADTWNVDDTFGADWPDWVMTVALAVHGCVHVKFTLLGDIVLNLRMDIKRRYETSKLFSAMLRPLDGGEYDYRLPSLDMLVPENLASWFWCRTVAQAIALDMYQRVQLYAGLVLFWIVSAFGFVLTQAVLETDVPLVVYVYAVSYSVLFLGLIVSVISMGGSVNTEGLANSLTLLRTRVRVREYLLMTREGRLEELKQKQAEAVAGSAGTSTTAPSESTRSARRLNREESNRSIASGMSGVDSSMPAEAKSEGRITLSKSASQRSVGSAGADANGISRHRSVMLARANMTHIVRTTTSTDDGGATPTRSSSRTLVTGTAAAGSGGAATAAAGAGAGTAATGVDGGSGGASSPPAREGGGVFGSLTGKKRSAASLQVATTAGTTSPQHGAQSPRRHLSNQSSDSPTADRPLAVLTDPRALASTRALLHEVVSLIDSVKDELTLFHVVRPLKLLGVDMGAPLVRALATLVVTSVGLAVRAFVLARRGV